MRTDHWLRSVLIVTGLLSMLSAAGCQTSQPGVTNTMGRYDMAVNAPPPRATRAALNVLEDDYKFKVESSALTAIDGKVEAQSAQGTKIWVWVERQGDNGSLVSVRVGAGDEKLSLEILGKIKESAKTIMERIREKV
jgi:hypothetical protein